MPIRNARFKIKATEGRKFEKADEATVTIVYQDPQTAVLEVRPLHDRKTFSLTLEEVARIVISRVSKANVL